MVDILSKSTGRGFTLIEVLVSMALLVTVSVGIAQLFGIAIAAGRAARDRTSAAILAAAKLEQLESLNWTYTQAAAGNPPVALSDLTTNLSVDPPKDNGPGLQPSPTGTLDTNVPPYVDFLDAHGRWTGNGATPPANAVFVRRWAVQPLPGGPDRTLVLAVLVTTVRQEASRIVSAPRVWTGNQALLVTLRTRKCR